MRGEDVRAEDIIADKIVRMAQGIKEKGKLGFPSTIYKLCKEAGDADFLQPYNLGKYTESYQ
ncbi:hypothetical protein PIB30_106148, partial [Stylosanthes scabra]|nr:hypothetical protein [Stylosanthes scabra]